MTDQAFAAGHGMGKCFPRQQSFLLARACYRLSKTNLSFFWSMRSEHDIHVEGIPLSLARSRRTVKRSFYGRASAWASGLHIEALLASSTAKTDLSMRKQPQVCRHRIALRNSEIKL